MTVSMEMSHREAALKFYILPFPSPGHAIPLINLAQLLASRGHDITVFTTVANAPKHLNVHTLDFPSDQVGLPPGLENVAAAQDNATSHKILKATQLLKPQIEAFVQRNPPHVLISDFMFRWSSELGVPTLLFTPMPIFVDCIMEAIYSQPQELLPLTSLPYVVPRGADLPHAVTFNFNPSSAPGFDPLAQLFLHNKHNNTHGLIVNSFAELEDGYTHCYEKLTGVKVWHVGMISLMLNHCSRKTSPSTQKDQITEDCLNWLSSKEPNSVLYICFGTLSRHNKEQQLEIARGIEASGHEFLWIFPKNMQVHVTEWLPHGFEERIKQNNRGRIVRGWVHQESILKHVAIGGFLMQCGWNSVTEGISAGVPLITMPRFAEQFLNEKLVTEVHKFGVEVGECEWSISPYDAKSSVVGWEPIKNAVERVMKDEGGSLKKRAKEMQEKAHQAIQEGGSSYNNLNALLESLKNIPG